VGLTLARYQTSMVAYSSFKAANFNALILGENTVEAMNAASPVVNKFGVNINTTGFRPGMRWDAVLPPARQRQSPFRYPTEP
jgi:hypothetical protein